MREKILQASIELFGEKGYKETSIQDLVAHIGVTKGTFYYYYASKQSILNDICMDYIHILLKKQTDILNNGSYDCVQKLRSMVLMLLKSIKDQRSSARIFFRDMRSLEESQFKLIKEQRDLFRDHFQMVIDEGIKQGVFRKDLQADMVTFGILGMANWTYYWYQPDGKVSEEQLADIFLNMALNGILAKMDAE
ncbi:TetR/AcrR family transcriptional regulator [Bacillus sp. 1P06AnD]|uniref:TetR/AcrR family transcriptional regulator n=1 Tax=Bacillus sp. 1P06AnD TaxID=3132208 RepID=UPI0039A359C3